MLGEVKIFLSGLRTDTKWRSGERHFLLPATALHPKVTIPFKSSLIDSIKATGNPAVSYI